MINPYAISTSVDDEEQIERERQNASPSLAVRPPFSLRRSITTWVLVCSIAATPSFFFGSSMSGSYSGMVVGVMIFIVIYIATDFATYDRPFRQHQLIRRVLRITYATRILITIVFPVGMVVDMFCGMVSVPFGSLTPRSEWDFRNGGFSMPFAQTLLTTLIQGVMLNIVLGVYAALLLGLGYAFRWLRPGRSGFAITKPETSDPAAAERNAKH